MFAITPLLILIFGLSAGGAEKAAEKTELKAAQAAEAAKVEQVAERSSGAEAARAGSEIGGSPAATPAADETE